MVISSANILRRVDLSIYSSYSSVPTGGIGVDGETGSARLMKPPHQRAARCVEGPPDKVATDVNKKRFGTNPSRPATAIPTPG